MHVCLFSNNISFIIKQGRVKKPHAVQPKAMPSKTIMVKPKVRDSGYLECENVPPPVYSSMKGHHMENKNKNKNAAAKNNNNNSFDNSGRKVSLTQLQNDICEQVADVRMNGQADSNTHGVLGKVHNNNGTAVTFASQVTAAAATAAEVTPLPKKRASIYAPFNSVDDTRHSARALSGGKRRKSYHEIVQESLEEKVNNLLECKEFQFVIFLSTMVALFGTDFVQAFLPPDPHDMVIAVLSAIIFGLFIFELVAASIVKPNYMFSFFFWLDLVGALSLLADMSFLWEESLFGGDGEGQDTLALLRAGRIVRTGTKSTRALRLVRLLRTARIIRMFRIVKMIKVLLNRKTEEENVSPDNAPSSRLGLRLADLLGKRVILGTIFLLFILPTLEVVVVDNSDEVGLSILEVFVKREVIDQNLTIVPALDPYFNNGEFTANQIDLGNNSLVPVTESGEYIMQKSDVVREAFELYTASFVNLTHVLPVMVMRIDGLYFTSAPIIELRAIRSAALQVTPSTSEDSIVAFDRTIIVEEQAVFNMTLTLILVFLMGLSAYMFNMDVHKYVVVPIQRTTAVIRRLANTLFLLSKEDDDADMDMMESTFVDIVVEQLNTFFKVGEDSPSVKVAPTPESEPASELDLEGREEIVHPIPGQETDEQLRQMIPNARVHCLDSIEECFADTQSMQFFKVFLTAEFAVESLTFINSVDQYTKYWGALKLLVLDINRKYVDERAKFQVNISDPQRTYIREHMENPTPEIFDMARSEILAQLRRDNFPRFKSSHLGKELVEVKKTKLKEYKMLKESQQLARTSKRNSTNGQEAGGMNSIVKMFAAKLMVSRWSSPTRKITFGSSPKGKSNTAR